MAAAGGSSAAGAALGINGFGRIGRLVCRAACKSETVNVVAINGEVSCACHFFTISVLFAFAIRIRAILAMPLRALALMRSHSRVTG